MASSRSQHCPLCSACVQEYYIHFDKTFSMCENVKCSYPFSETHVNPFVKTIPTTTTRYGKAKHRQSSVAVVPSKSALQCNRQGDLSLSSLADPQSPFPTTQHDVSIMETLSAHPNTTHRIDPSHGPVDQFTLAEIENLLNRDDDDVLATPKDSADLAWLDEITNLMPCAHPKTEPMSLSRDLDELFGSSPYSSS